VEERDLVTEDAASRPLVDELCSCRRKAGELGTHVVDLERDVMHARASLREELADRSIGTASREQLDATLADAEKRNVGTLVLEGLPELHLGAEQAAVRLDRPLEVVDCDPDVVEAADGHPGDATGGQFLSGRANARSVL
jgi:hypothetical protein